MLSKRWDKACSKFGVSIVEVRFSGDNISINTEVWNNVILWMLVLISLEFQWSTALGFKAFWEIAELHAGIDKESFPHATDNFITLVPRIILSLNLFLTFDMFDAFILLLLLLCFSY